MILSVFVIGASVWYQPQDILLSMQKGEMDDIYIKIYQHGKAKIIKDVVVIDETGNPFSMRNLDTEEYPLFVQKSMQIAQVLSCRQYTYAGQTWYEWCTEEAGEWVMYRWEHGQITLIHKI